MLQKKKTQTIKKLGDEHDIYLKGRKSVFRLTSTTDRC